MLDRQEIISPNLLEIKASQLRTLLESLDKLERAFVLAETAHTEIAKELESKWSCSGYHNLVERVSKTSDTLAHSLLAHIGIIKKELIYLEKSANVYRQFIKEE